MSPAAPSTRARPAAARSRSSRECEAQQGGERPPSVADMRKLFQSRRKPFPSRREGKSKSEGRKTKADGRKNQGFFFCEYTLFNGLRRLLAKNPNNLLFALPPVKHFETM